MKCILTESYGGPEVLQVEEVPVPQVGPNGVLVRIHATSVNPLDWKLRQGLLRPVMDLRFPIILGCDFSGVVEKVGNSVTLFKPGDEVYGFKDGRVGKTYRGTYAEYAVAPEKAVARKPANLSHEEAAAMPVAAVSAWQGLVKYGKIKAGSRVLIHAGAGGVGSFAIQTAKAFGAYVAATASGRNQDLLRELGADLPIDYEQERFEEKISGYDVVLDNVGKSVWGGSLSVLKPGGRLVSLVPPSPKEPAGKLRFFASTGSQVAGWALRGLLTGKFLTLLMVKPQGGELEKLTALVEAGKVKPVIQKVYSLEEIAEAHTVSEQGHVRGKLVLRI
ncbi:MAG: NADPH:quinone reductase [Candidatus Angelobacter sp. Gp1-AA117]|nr:MAG: NADPH:quinone reductase [Candidatus Angelobacter sp. Gp1-AA117]